MRYLQDFDLEWCLKSGAGGIRTLVQTSNNNAFYMLSPDSFFDARPTQNRLSYA